MTDLATYKDALDALMTAQVKLASWETTAPGVIETLGHVGHDPEDLYEAVELLGKMTEGSQSIHPEDLKDLTGIASVLLGLQVALSEALGHVDVESWKGILEPIPALLRLRVMRLATERREAILTGQGKGPS